MKRLEVKIPGINYLKKSKHLSVKTEIPVSLCYKAFEQVNLSGDEFFFTLYDAFIRVFNSQKKSKQLADWDLPNKTVGNGLCFVFLAESSNLDLPQQAQEKHQYLSVTQNAKVWTVHWMYEEERLLHIPLFEQFPNIIEEKIKALASGEASKDWSTIPPSPQLLEFEQGAHQSYPVKLVHDFLSRQAKATPDKIALRHGQQSITYQDLEDQSNQLANYLNQKGVGTSSIIGLFFNRSFEMIIAMLGVLKSGAAFVALDPYFPQARIDIILEDAQPQYILCVEKNRQISNYPQQQILVYQTQARPFIEQAKTIAFEHDQMPDRMYIIYTSGSTGKPKGIIQRHRAISNLLQWQSQSSGIKTNGPVLQFSSLIFDVSLQEIFGTFSQGGSVVLIEQRDRLDPQRLIQVMADYEIETAFLSISLLNQIFSRKEYIAAIPKCLTHIVTAGEQLLISEPISAFLQKHPHLHLHNHYGVSESHVVTTYTLPGGQADYPYRVPVGFPIANTRIKIVDEEWNAVPIGVIGEIWIAGDCLAEAYWNLPEKTAWHFKKIQGEQWYRTGDLGYWLSSGAIVFIGRFDDQVKVNGHLVELGDVEAALQSHPEVLECAVVLRQVGKNAVNQLWGFYLTDQQLSEMQLRHYLNTLLPSFMIPIRLIQLPQMPLGNTGKIDRKALINFGEHAENKTTTTSQVDWSKQIEHILKEILDLEVLPGKTSFFDLGFNSVLLVQAANQISDLLGQRISPVLFYQHSNFQAFIQHLQSKQNVSASVLPSVKKEQNSDAPEIAIVGMAGKFPGAANIEAYWELLLAGQEGLEVIPEEKEQASIFIPPWEEEHPLEKLYGRVKDHDHFDHQFFGFTPREALWTDPQQRLFLECCWFALEDAGCAPDLINRNIGIFAGGAVNSYMYHLKPYINSLSDYFQALAGNDKDFLASKVAYKLDLRGPALSVQTACSTSLVAIHLAAQSIKRGECVAALAGATSVLLPQEHGHPYQEGFVYAPDGKTRPFDVKARGMNTTNGVGVVLLKRLDLAIEHQDRIYGLIKGSAINNDGARKVGYTAPSVEGQYQVIERAYQDAGIDPKDIDFIEAHGTGTNLGDQIETAALHKAFGQPDGSRKIALGSSKGNIGHTNRSSGIAGLIKASLSLYHEVLPGTINIEEENPALNLQNSSFFIPKENIPLKKQTRPLRGGVSAFGIGGTNAHVIVEAFSQDKKATKANYPQVLPFSAKNEEALSLLLERMSVYLDEHPEIPIDAIAYTLQNGREHFKYRSAIVMTEPKEGQPLSAQLAVPISGTPSFDQKPKLAFLFPGQGAEIRGMGKSLYHSCPTFREWIDKGRYLFEEVTGVALLPLITGTLDKAELEIYYSKSRYLQAMLFVYEVALAKQLLKWKIEPSVMVGHSTGQFAAACIAGVFSFEDGIRMMARRGQLMDEVAPKGKMISVLLDESGVQEYTGQEVFVGALNGKMNTVLSGTPTAIEHLATQLEKDEVSYRVLKNHNANHSPFMEAMAPMMREVLETVKLHPPRPPIVSNISGRLLGDQEACSIDYWVEHLIQAVDFSTSLDTLIDLGVNCWLEVGPNNILSKLSNFHYGLEAQKPIFPTFPVEPADLPEDISLIQAVAKLWELGYPVDWSLLTPVSSALKVKLPGHPMTKQSFFMPLEEPNLKIPPTKSSKKKDMGQWIYQKKWHRSRPLLPFLEKDLAGREITFLCFIADEQAWVKEVVERISAEGIKLILVYPGSSFAKRSAFEYELDPLNRADYKRLSETISTANFVPNQILYCWSQNRGEDFRQSYDAFLNAYTDTLLPLNWVSEDFIMNPSFEIDLWIITEGRFLMDQNGQGPKAHPETMEDIYGVLATVLQQEYRHLNVKQIDLSGAPEAKVNNLLSEIADGSHTNLVAYKDQHRFESSFEPAASPDQQNRTGFKAKGIYLITGGLGKLGVGIARHLVKQYDAQVILLGRTSFLEPPVAGNRTPGWLKKKELLEALQTYSDQIHYYSLDIADSIAVEERLDRIYEELGSINGIIHAAAKIDQDSFFKYSFETNEDILHEQLYPKIGGMLAIDSAIKDRAIDFKVAFSSISTVLGGLGYLSYAASNQAMEICARSNNWYIIHWDVWETSNDISEEYDWTITMSLRKNAMSLEEGIFTLERLLSATAAERYVSTSLLANRMEAVKRLTMEEEGDLKEEHPPANGVAEALSLYEKVSSTWQKALGIKHLQPHNNFLQLGGDSLTALQTTLSLSKLLNKKIPVASLLGAADLESFVQHVDALIREEGDAMPAFKAWNYDEYPLSPWQARWYDMEKRGFGYLEVPIEIKGPFDPVIAFRALCFVLNDQKVLRSIFPLIGEERKQVLADIPFTSLPMIDLTSQAFTEQLKFMEEHLEEKMFQPFALDQEIPIRLCLYKLAAEHHVFFMYTHHIVFDGWSSSVFWENLMLAYEALETSNQLPPQPSEYQYGDFSIWYQSFEQSKAYAETVSYWREHFKGNPSISALPEQANAASDHHLARCLSISIASAEVNQLKAIAEHYQCTLYTIMMTIFALTIKEILGSDDLIIGSTSAGRNRPETFRMSGVFVNPLPLRFKIATTDIAQVLKEVIEVVDGFLNHQNFPLSSLLEEVPAFENVDINETFHIYLLYQNYPKPKVMNKLQFNIFEADNTMVDDPMEALFSLDEMNLMRRFELIIYEQEDTLACNFWYRTQLYSASQVQGWMALFQNNMRRFIKDLNPF